MTTKAPLVVIVGSGFGGLAAAKGLRGARLIIRRRANDGEAVLAKDNTRNFTMAIEKAVYTAHARATGGRVGTAKSDDGQIDLKLDRPIEMGGKGNGTNPEQLFAAGYAACFIGALRVVAGKRHIRIPEDVAIDSAVSFDPFMSRSRSPWKSSQARKPTVMGEEFVLIQRKEDDSRSVLLLAMDLNQHCHENL